ncbi:MAG: RNA-guided pseudouridylation complex pseudouridine synthase subunit Cbf5 [Candidatus Aenigmarchaeota archaeon]|nr:RNA-guided pseudouridylation complex pseudouridine synthase subunit Cbf5 [Candidatus Aenigmarchaeota archaeon]
MLPICLDNATKIMPALQGLDKEYVGIMHIHQDVDEKQITDAAKKFVGKIKQTPPVRSAVARKERERTVHSFEILEVDGRDVLFRISCQAGTYVRVVCHQLGKLIGGANMTELRRTKVGHFDEKSAVRIQDVADAYHDWKESQDDRIRDFVLPVEKAVEHLKKIIVKDSSVFSVASGSPLYSTGVSRVQKDISADEMVCIFTLKGELVGLGTSRMTSDQMQRKGIAAKVDRVIIDKAAYKM